MKRILLLLFIILISIPSRSLPGDYHVIDYDGMRFEICDFDHGNDGHVVLMSNDYSGDFVIPDSIDVYDTRYRVTMRRAVSGISYEAFHNCSELLSVTIPITVRFLGSYNETGIYYRPEIGLFGGCNNLQRIIVNEKNTVFDTRDGCNAIISTSDNRLVAGCNNTIIPSTITAIDDYAFEGCTGMTIVKIPEGCNMIGVGAFWGCCNLSDMYLYSRPSIGYHLSSTDNGEQAFKCAFDKSVNNTTLHVRDVDIESIREELSFNPNSWMYFKEIVIIEKVTDFNLKYYVDGKEYKTVKYKYDDEITPEPAPEKEGYTFSGWEGLPTNMPGKDVKVYGTFTRNEVKENSVIYWTLNEKAFVLGNDNASGGVSIAEKVTFNERELPVTEIMDNAFNGCKGITTIDMPATITSIGERAFAGIDKLTDVTIGALEVPETDRTAFENSYIEDYVTLHVNGAAIKKYKETAPWKNFKEIVAIPGTEVIEKYKLTYMVDGEEYKVVEINEGDSITPEAIPTKEGYTFSGWGDIPDVMPSQDVTVSGTFTVNKYKLVYIIDGEEYKTVEVEYGSAITPEAYPEKEGYTFSGWDNVPETMPAGNVTVTGYFTVNKYTITYYVDGEVYKTVEVEYGSEITAEEEPTKEGYDFSGWSWIPSKMPAEDVTVTGSFTKASYEVDGATYQIDENGATLTSVDNAAGDVVLDATVTINGKTYRITVIGEGAFQGNDRITSLTVPDGIETIMQNAFDGCSKLMKLMLGKNVRYIGSKAFAGIGRAAARTRADAEPLTIECYAESVPQADSDCFEGVDVASAILKVNDELTGVYKTTSPWNQFGSILGFNEAASVVSIFTDEEGAEIYSIDGRRVDKVQKGMNIIRTREGVRKVVVK